MVVASGVRACVRDCTFACVTEGVTVLLGGSLLIHVRTHSGEKPCKCDMWNSL